MSWQEAVREWVGLIGGLAGIAVALRIWGKPMLGSFFPIRIVPLEKAYTVAHQGVRNEVILDELMIKVRVETLKRTTGPITKLNAYVKELELGMLDLLPPYHQPPLGIDEQTLSFGFLPNGEYQGKTLVIVAQCRMRKGKRAIKKSVLIR